MALFFKGEARFKQKCFYFLRLCTLFFSSKSVLSSTHPTHIEMDENDDGISVLFPPSSLVLWEKVNSSMSNKTVLYPDHFVGPCINHLRGHKEKEKDPPHIHKKSLFGIETKQPNYQELCILMLHDLTKTTQSQIFLKIVSYSQFVE